MAKYGQKPDYFVDLREYSKAVGWQVKGYNKLVEIRPVSDFDNLGEKGINTICDNCAFKNHDIICNNVACTAPCREDKTDVYYKVLKLYD